MNMLSYFPHETPRDWQSEIISQIRSIYEDYDYFIIEGSTGLGKTAVLGSLASYIGSSYYLTEQKVHQRQVSEEFEKAKSVVGISNYEDCGINSEPRCGEYMGDTCDRKPSVDYGGEMACESDTRNEVFWNSAVMEENRCPYMVDKCNSVGSDFACLNYSLFLHEMGSVNSDFGKRKLQILDEAHNVPANVRDFLSLEVTRDGLNDLGLDMEDKGSAENWYNWITDNLVDCVRARIKQSRDKERVTELEEYLTKMRRLESLFVHDVEWIIDKIYKDDEIERIILRPLDVAPYCAKYLFDYAEKVFFSSATISNVDVFLGEVGLKSKKSNIYMWNIDDIFSPENRKIVFANGINVNYQNKDRTLANIAKIIENLLDNHQGEKGIIHSVSFDNGDKIMGSLSTEYKKRIMRHSGDVDRDMIIDYFKKSDGDQVLMSPSIFEGLSLDGDKSRFQIVPKVPYLSLGSNFVEAKMDQNYLWYLWRTAIKMIQSFGRSVRSKEDYAKTYVLDGNFEKIINSGMLPDSIVGEDGSLVEADIHRIAKDDNIKAI